MQSLVSQAELGLLLAWNNLYKIMLRALFHWLEEKLVVIVAVHIDLYEYLMGAFT